MDLKKFISHAKDQGFTWCRIYEPESRHLIAAYFTGKDEKSSDQKEEVKDFCKRIENFAENFPGTYNIEAKKSSNIGADNICKFRVVFGDTEAFAGQLQGKQIASSISEEEIEKRILQGIERERKIRDKEEEAEELREELKEMKTHGGKLAYVLGEVFQGLFMKGAFSSIVRPQAALAGTPERDPSENLSDSDNAKLKKAIEMLLDIMDIDTIYAIASKLKEKPELLNSIKPFLL